MKKMRNNLHNNYKEYLIALKLQIKEYVSWIIKRSWIIMKYVINNFSDEYSSRIYLGG